MKIKFLFLKRINYVRLILEFFFINICRIEYLIKYKYIKRYLLNKYNKYMLKVFIIFVLIFFVLVLCFRYLKL